MNVDRKLSLLLCAAVLSALLTGLTLLSCAPDTDAPATDSAAARANEAARSAALAGEERSEAVGELVAANDALLLRVEQLESELARTEGSTRSDDFSRFDRYETYEPSPVRVEESSRPIASDRRAYVERSTYEAPASRWDEGYREPDATSYEEPVIYQDRAVATDVSLRDDDWRTADIRRDVPRPRDLERELEREDVQRREPTYRRLTVEPGTKISVEMLDPISTRYSQPGESFRARLAGDLLADNGQVAIPDGAEVTGHVTEVKKNQRIGGRAALAIRLDRIELPDGSMAPITAAWSTRGKSQTPRDAATIGGATVGGAVLGRILDKGDGDVIGGLIGAAAGTAVAHQAIGKPIALGQGAVLRMTLRSPIEVRVRN